MSISQGEQDVIWKHYQNDGAASFDASYSRLRYLAERRKPGELVLNIGVGSGYLEELLVDRGVEVYALDPGEHAIARIRDRLALGLRAKQGYSNAIPFAAGMFDAVIMTEVLEHLSDATLHATLDEVSRVLKPGGEFTGTVPFRENLKDNEVLCPRCEALFHRWGHQASFDKPSLMHALTQHGFQVRKLYPRSFPDFRRPGLRAFAKALIRYVLGRLGEPLIGPNLYFVAQTSRVRRASP